MAARDNPASSYLPHPERIPLQFHFDPGKVDPEEGELMAHIKQELLKAICSRDFKRHQNELIPYWKELETNQKMHVIDFHLLPYWKELETNQGIQTANTRMEGDGNQLQVAEQMLYHWKSFPITLPPSLTNQGETKTEEKEKKGMINYRDLFKAPTFDELEQVATDPFGELKKLTDAQLKDVWEKGEFEVASVNFPGQTHRWKLTQLLQKGSQIGHNSLLSDTALALRLLIITARNRFISPFFSLSESLKSWGRGFWKILDIVIGMPSTSPGELEIRIRTEHMRYLVAELNVKASYRQGFGKFCQFVKETTRMSTKEKNKKPTLRPPPIPYIYQTPKGMDIDLRLFNKDLINNCLPVLSNILEREARGWYIQLRQKLIVELKGQGLSNEEISRAVNDAIKEEYLQRVFKAILSNAELESIEPGIGNVLVAQAKAAVVMQKATNSQHQKLQRHKEELLVHLKKAYPVKSRIPAWVNEQTVAFEREFVLRHLWAAHEEAIHLCEEEDLQQAIYFLRRDLNFIKERESILLAELSRVRIPDRVFTFSVRIWMPKNWITIKSVEGEDTIVPTVFGHEDKPQTNNGEHSVFYHLNKYTSHKTTTRYPFWRWYNYLHRTWAWMWNSIFFFGIMVPWASPLSVRALFSTAQFQPDFKICQKDGRLYKNPQSTTETLGSRLAAIWRSVRKSRKNFESAPDRGFLGKSMTRHFNRIWNYVIKGMLGSLLLVAIFPVLCILVSVLSVCLAIGAPAWCPLVTLLAHLISVLVYDLDRPSVDINAICIVGEAIIWRFLIQGTIQPVVASVIGFIVCPLAAMGISVFGITRRGCRAVWDTFMYYAVIRSRARVPASDGFVARRIAGPGLASLYYLQIRPEQALAALEANMELEELDAFKMKVTRLIDKPVHEYKRFVSTVFKPFAAGLVEDGVFKQLLTETSLYKTDLSNKISQRQWRLNTSLDCNIQSKIKLQEKDLKLTIVLAAKMLESFYPNHVFDLMSMSEVDFWEHKSLEFRDWKGLASQKLSHIFCSNFLVPLEETDPMFELKIEHLNLVRYMKMIESTRVRDDLDVVTEVNTETGDVATRKPHLDPSFFNPTQKIVQTRRYHSIRKRRFPWLLPKFEAEFDKLEVPLPIPHPAVIALSIYNREHEQFAISFDDLLCRALISAIQSFTEFADPATTVSMEPEMSTPDNGVEPLSIVSHLAEQEQSISDDNSNSVAANSHLIDTTTTATTNLAHTPFIEHRVNAFVDDDLSGDSEVKSEEQPNLRRENLVTENFDRASINTENQIEDNIYVEEEDILVEDLNSSSIPLAPVTSSGETSF